MQKSKKSTHPNVLHAVRINDHKYKMGSNFCRLYGLSSRGSRFLDFPFLTTKFGLAKEFYDQS
jgi:hypothetical protein